jgi:hypothetical protein
MTRTTERARRIKRLRTIFRERIEQRCIREFDCDYDSVEDDLDGVAAFVYDRATATRYHEPRGQYRKTSYEIFQRDLGWMLSDDSVEVTEGEDIPWLTEDEFRQKYRVSKQSFQELYGLIKDDPVFSARGGKTGRKQAHPAFQLAVLLKYLGTEGSGNSNPDLRNQFRIGRGTTKLWRDRARVAVRRLRNQALTWPDDSERAVISKRIFEQYDWPNCIGIMDGTLFPLAFEPQTEDAPDYHGRKFAYSITCLIICDDQRRVRYFHCGWPGSTHDERVFRNCQISKDPDKWLSPTQYILGDTAYENDWYVLSSFRKPAGGIMPHEQEVFNSAMKTLRVVSEHTIGILKGRFPWSSKMILGKALEKCVNMWKPPSFCTTSWWNKRMKYLISGWIQMICLTWKIQPVECPPLKLRLTLPRSSART